MTKQEIGSILMNLREKSGKTREEVAELLGKSVKTIGHWETGYAQPDANTLFLLCVIYDADLNSSFGFPPSSTKNSPSTAEAAPGKLSAKEQTHIKKYRFLDPHGKEAVDSILDIEYERCTELTQPVAPEPADIIYTVPSYTLPMSAGLGEPAGQEPPEDFALKKAPPRGTSYIARVHGNSMEQSYYDGQLVFVHATEKIPVGKIGVFFMDGQQWVKELGDGVLISHNPNYPPRPMAEDTRCQGLVLGVCDESYFE